MKAASICFLIAACLLPVLAQAQATSSTVPSVNTRMNGGSSAELPAGRPGIMTGNGGMRASRIIGAEVFNDHGDKVGTVDDLVIASNQSLQVVISVGGFLGFGAKLVRVPFDKLQFGSGSGTVVLPGVTRQALLAMPGYHFTSDEG